MSRTSLRRLTLVAVIFIGGLARAEAGPPLICQAFPTLDAPSLPWKATGNSWNGADPRYDLAKLTSDTLRLLTPQTPVLARMEIMRRATIYAARRQDVANELLSRVMDRVNRAEAEGRSDTAAWFDAGYLVESYRQAIVLAEWDMLPAADKTRWMREVPSTVDGYALVRRALAASDATPEMELAAALMTHGALSEAHLAKARGR
jgi:hypothetical protein